MERTQDSIYFSNVIDSTRISDISTSYHQPNILRDNYSLEEIFKIKLHESIKLLNELNNLNELENSAAPEKTINFTDFIKDKRDYIASLCEVIYDSKPSAYPKYRAEGYLKLAKSLSLENNYLKDIEKDLKEKKNQYSLKNENMALAYQKLTEVMETPNTGQHKTEDVISIKLAQMMFEDAKNLMTRVFKTIFPDNESLIDVLVDLEHASEQATSDESKKWINFSAKNYDCILFLLDAGIIKIRHPQDIPKISLVSFTK